MLNHEGSATVEVCIIMAVYMMIVWTVLTSAIEQSRKTQELTQNTQKAIEEQAFYVGDRNLQTGCFSREDWENRDIFWRITDQQYQNYRLKEPEELMRVIKAVWR